MTGAEAVALARRRGVTLGVFLGNLRVYSEGEPDESLVRLLRDNKQAVMDAILAAETESDRWRRILAEKTQTITQLRGLTRPDAEREAFQHVVVEFLNRTHPNADPNRCALCGKTETPDAVLLPYGVGERHAWLHRGCWDPWRERRCAAAIAELSKLGVVERSCVAAFRLSRRHRKHILLDQLRVRPGSDRNGIA
jgi:hypothetical protein